MRICIRISHFRIHGINTRGHAQYTRTQMEYNLFPVCKVRCGQLDQVSYPCIVKQPHDGCLTTPSAKATWTCSLSTIRATASNNRIMDDITWAGSDQVEFQCFIYMIWLIPTVHVVVVHTLAVPYLTHTCNSNTTISDMLGGVVGCDRLFFSFTQSQSLSLCPAKLWVCICTAPLSQYPQPSTQDTTTTTTTNQPTNPYHVSLWFIPTSTIQQQHHNHNQTATSELASLLSCSLLYHHHHLDIQAFFQQAHSITFSQYYTRPSSATHEAVEWSIK